MDDWQGNQFVDNKLPFTRGMNGAIAPQMQILLQQYRQLDWERY